MKKWVPVLILVCMAGCNRPKHVSGAEFERQFELRNAQTMVWAEYLGQEDGKVYLRRKTMSLVRHGWNEEIWYTETNNLDSAFLDRLSGTSGREERGNARRDSR